MKFLVTGGTGYIGSHTIVELLAKGHEVVIVDNLINSSLVVLKKIEKITSKKPAFYKVDITTPVLKNIFNDHQFDAVIHFAALKAVGESVNRPLKYYRNNITGLLNLMERMEETGVDRLIFSSSATVYGEPESVPITEDFPTGVGITNPYGQTKAIAEQIIRDYSKSRPGFKATLLRYFNPAGAHKSGLIGEDPNGIPNNLLPFVSQVAVGILDKVMVFGDDYKTKDGTGVRDYIHVTDLARGHLAALNHTPSAGNPDVYNLGTGTGYSVLEIIEAFEKASGKKIPYEIVDRRPGDVAECYADPSKATRELNWKAEKTLSEMCEDAWRWQSKNPNGYK